MHELCPQLSELSWLQHGFFGRENGVTNAKTGIEYFSQRFPRVSFLPQTHSATIIQRGETFPDCGADAQYTSSSAIALAVKTADCCPILVACPSSKMVAAIHAGWPGALNQITLETIHKMQKLGANPNRMIAAIGPCLHQESFAVQDDVRDKFAAQHPGYLSHFAPFEDRWKLDMAGIVRQQLLMIGVFEIWQSQIDTLPNESWHSYRRRATDPDSENGRNVSIISIVDNGF